MNLISGEFIDHRASFGYGHCGALIAPGPSALQRVERTPFSIACSVVAA
jgi:hypothetical protein